MKIFVRVSPVTLMGENVVYVDLN